MPYSHLQLRNVRGAKMIFIKTLISYQLMLFYWDVLDDSHLKLWRVFQLLPFRCTSWLSFETWGSTKFLLLTIFIEVLICPPEAKVKYTLILNMPWYEPPSFFDNVKSFLLVHMLSYDKLGCKDTTSRQIEVTLLGAPCSIYRLA